MAADPKADPARELELGPALRDVLLGAAILALGWITGGSAFDADRDRLDVFFDVLGGALLLWGLARLALRLARTRR